MSRKKKPAKKKPIITSALPTYWELVAFAETKKPKKKAKRVKS